MSLYGRKWKAARLVHLQQEPLCRYCQQQGRVTAATVVDHITPHKGDLKLFWSRSNWQSLCKPHHDATKQREERTGAVLGCDKDGYPVDPKHHWNG